jgi:hypothetical protein
LNWRTLSFSDRKILVSIFNPAWDQLVGYDHLSDDFSERDRAFVDRRGDENRSVVVAAAVEK